MCKVLPILEQCAYLEIHGKLILRSGFGLPSDSGGAGGGIWVLNPWYEDEDDIFKGRAGGPVLGLTDERRSGLHPRTKISVKSPRPRQPPTISHSSATYTCSG